MSKNEGSTAPTSGLTTIPAGTTIFHDFGVYRWPKNANAEEADPEQEFEVSVQGDTVALRADGFGGNPYRSGVVLVKLTHWEQAWAGKIDSRFFNKVRRFVKGSKK